MNVQTKMSRGFTLIELMVVLAIIAILLTVALPAYQEQIRKTKRTVAKGALLEVRGRQEQFFVNNKQYATVLTALGYGTNPFSIDVDGNDVATSSSDRIYTISISGATATAFTLEATPQLGQTKDTRCGKLTLTHLGVKGENGTQSVAECW